jgi:hypothetical protein
MSSDENLHEDENITKNGFIKRIATKALTPLATNSHF